MSHDSQLIAPLIVIVGETASGKSALAFDLAKRFNGEIICADSRTVYQELNIGTAKPSAEERARIPHNLLDLVRPDQSFTAAEFKKHANQSIVKITKSGKLPIMVGGTGLYIDGVIYDFGFEKNLDKHPLRSNTLVIGLMTEKDILKSRIAKRTAKMIKNGLTQEVKELSAKYGWHVPAMSGIGYKEFQAYLAGMQTLAETIDLINRNTYLYAKRQRTWFKRNKDIQWQSDPSNSVDLVTTFLNT